MSYFASSELESSVLGTILVDPDAIVLLCPIIKREYFFEAEHQEIWDAVESIIKDGKTPSFEAVVAALDAEKKLKDVGGRAYLVGLINASVSARLAMEYVKTLEDLAVKRSIIQFASNLVAEAQDKRGEELIGEIFSFAHDIVRGGRYEEVERVDAIVDRLWATITARMNHPEDICLRTNIPALDSYQLFTRGNMVVLAGRPGMGKSALASHVAMEVAKQGIPVVLFSLEMSKDSVVERIVANISGVSISKIRSGRLDDDDVGRVVNAMGEISEVPLFIDDSAATTPDMLLAKVRVLQAKVGRDIGLVIVDYLQLLQPPRFFPNRVQEVTYTSSMLKMLAREEQVPVLALSQLNRAVEERNDKRPVLADLRESGAIEQDADAVIFIHREEMYDTATERKGLADIIVAKNRHGAVGDFTVTFDAAHAKFSGVEVKTVSLEELLGKNL